MRYWLALFVGYVGFGFGQTNPNPENFKAKFPSYFAMEIQPLFPSDFISPRTVSLTTNSTNGSLTMQNGNAFGGILRLAFTDRFALETGLHYNQYQLRLGMQVPDSNVSYQTGMKFTNFYLPVTGLVFVKLSESMYANAGLGLVALYKPSNVGVVVNPASKHVFAHGGLITQKFGLHTKAQFGFEFRSRKSGFFYLGGSAFVPLTPLFTYLLKYEYQNTTERAIGEIRGGYFSVDFRYYFHNTKNKGAQSIKGPIEQ